MAGIRFSEGNRAFPKQIRPNRKPGSFFRFHIVQQRRLAEAANDVVYPPLLCLPLRYSFFRFCLFIHIVHRRSSASKHHFLNPHRKV
ncbi:unnamed protein product [Citrullus colocynthis]|uniref:Uncharacterized protein n=1 Tax=Citrullus colocynthis TaxID=252529 RepID=A0ABP0YBB0_9ROSI